MYSMQHIFFIYIKILKKTQNKPKKPENKQRNEFKAPELPNLVEE